MPLRCPFGCAHTLWVKEIRKIIQNIGNRKLKRKKVNNPKRPKGEKVKISADRNIVDILREHILPVRLSILLCYACKVFFFLPSLFQRHRDVSILASEYFHSGPY